MKKKGKISHFDQHTRNNKIDLEEVEREMNASGKRMKEERKLLLQKISPSSVSERD
jgi:hypothetical protein